MHEASKKVVNAWFLMVGCFLTKGTYKSSYFFKIKDFSYIFMNMGSYYIAAIFMFLIERRANEFKALELFYNDKRICVN